MGPRKGLGYDCMLVFLRRLNFAKFVSIRKEVINYKLFRTKFILCRRCFTRKNPGTGYVKSLRKRTRQKILKISAPYLGIGQSFKTHSNAVYLVCTPLTSWPTSVSWDLWPLSEACRPLSTLPPTDWARGLLYTEID
jgi:hypothetical protein